MNHPRLKINRKEGIAFGETVLMSSPPSRSQIAVRPNSGFGGWVHEKIKSAREAVPLLRRKKSHPQHLTISQGGVEEDYADLVSITNPLDRISLAGTVVD